MLASDMLAHGMTCNIIIINSNDSRSELAQYNYYCMRIMWRVGGDHCRYHCLAW